MQSQTVIFRQLAKDFMRPLPCMVAADTPISEAVGRMAAAKDSCALVLDDGGRLQGIVTEQDVARRIAFRVTPETTVGDVMTTPVRTIPDRDHLYQAIARMRRFDHRHMPVVDRSGAPVGLLVLRDAMAVASEQKMAQIDRLTHQGTLDGLREVKAAEVELAEELFADNLPAPEIQALLTDINNDIYRRIVERLLRRGANDGLGEPPRDFSVIVMGSGGRGENFIYPDQDNGMIIADYPDGEHDRIDGYFRELAERMNMDLDTVGFPLCKGYVMAINPLWRKTLSQWREQLSLWQKKRDTTALRLSDIFFDFCAVYGDEQMAAEVRQTVTQLTKGNASFLREMFRDESEHKVALGLFGRLITERNIEEHKGKLNLKLTGTLPLVEGVRLMALREGVEVGSTLARIDRLRELDVLDSDEQDYLKAAFVHITGLLLRQQIADFKAGRTVSNYVSPKALSRREKDQLIGAFQAIREFRKRIESEFTGDLF
ncbi:MAG: putative nucleotidyltransferase substrate binding domain-containing protein [Alphaproteobacteria bacterium]|nr:putative nucleotidyltransferase substrate binding domain-containing protein [Alphaproteobacteria bacterium]